MVKQYVGARYVPKFASPVEWASNTSYEALTIVTFNNASYTSKVPVPPTVGNPANNPQYWALTGNYNAQVEQYRQETETVSNNLTTEITNRKNTDTTLQGNINSEASTRASADSNLQSQINQIIAPSGEAPSAAEVQNARIGADGVTYDTLGTAIRSQVGALKGDLVNMQEVVYHYTNDSAIVRNKSIYSSNGLEANLDGYGIIPFVYLHGLLKIKMQDTELWGSNIRAYIALYDGDKAYLGDYKPSSVTEDIDVDKLTAQYPSAVYVSLCIILKPSGWQVDFYGIKNTDNNFVLLSPYKTYRDKTIVNEQGDIIYGADYKTTLPIALDKVYAIQYSGAIGNSGRYMGICLYDAGMNKVANTVIDSLGSGWFYTKYTSAKYAVFSIKALQESWVKIAYKEDNKEHTTVRIGVGTPYPRLRDGISQAVSVSTNENPVTIYVKKGTYDLCEEFATELSADALSSVVGIGLGNSVKIIFESGAYVKAIYEPSGINGKDGTVRTWFQPFYGIGGRDNTGYIIENLNIECKGTRYCIHETGANSNQRKVVLKNCVMKYTAHRSGIGTQCIGGELGVHDYIEIDGGHYESHVYNSVNTNVPVISYHNTSLDNAYSQIFIKDLYIANEGYMYFTSYGPSKDISEVFVSGCRMGNNIQVDPSGSTPNNMKVTQWNNIIGG